MASNERYQEWTAVTEASAANLPTVINAKLAELPPVQTYGTEKVVGSHWVFDKVVVQGTTFVLFFWRWNHRV